MEKSSLDFDTFFDDDQEEQESTRVSGVLKKMKSDENLDLIFDNLTKRRYKRILGVIVGIAVLIFAINIDGLQTYRDAMYAGVENALLSVTDKETIGRLTQFFTQWIDRLKTLFSAIF
ncbi:MAG: hypothetical protein AB8G05_24280 [Oligoflexales bacterium]